jgi:hypothetical protein
MNDHSFLQCSFATSRFTFRVFLFFAFLASTSAARAQCRVPTPAEKAVVEKAFNVLKTAIDEPLKNTDLKFNRFHSDEGLALILQNLTVAEHPSPARPLEFCNGGLGGGQLMVDPDGPRAQAIAAQREEIRAKLQEAGEKEEKDWAELKRLTARDMDLAAALQVNIGVGENDPLGGSNPDNQSRTYTVINVPGAAFAHRYSNKGNENKNQTTEVVEIWFGDWNISSPTPNPAGPGRFHFKHPVGTPYIENLYVGMEGTPENLAILLKSINWQKFNEALTK